MSAVADIDLLSSIPSEILQASGPLGQIYALQLDYSRAQHRLASWREFLYEQIDREERDAHARGLMGSLTSAYDRVERHPEVVAAREQEAKLRAEVASAHAEVGGIVFLPAVDNLDAINKRLASLNRKAAKLSTDAISLTVSDEQLVLHYSTSEEDHRGADYRHVFTVLAGTTPKVDGFEFLAAVTPTEQGNVVKRIPAIRYGMKHNLDPGDNDREASPAKLALDEIDLTRFHTTGDICEHCRKDRRRSDCYVVYNETTGEALQVGRTCLRDYMGTNNPEQVVKVLEQVWEFMRTLGASRGEREEVATTTFLTHCAAVMRAQGGYKSGLGHDGIANLFNFLKKKTHKGQPLWVEPTEADEAAATMILRWVRNDWNETSEFATNVKTALASEYMNPKLYGYAGAAFIAHEKWLGREAKRQATEAKPSEFVGSVGERTTLALTITGIKWIADRSGYRDDATKPLLLMTDEHGNIVKWFASRLPWVADTDSHPVIGGTYQVKAAVKGHEENTFRDTTTKETMITRAKFEKTISEPEEDNE